MNEKEYNMDNKNANDEWNAEVAGETVTGNIVERINKKDFVTLTKPTCKHTNVTRRPATEFDGNVTEVDCNDCCIGWFER